MNVFYQMLVAVAVYMVAGGVAVWAILTWIGRGESDVNGDPERDAGLLPGPALPRVICMDCQTIIRAGAEPVSHGLCVGCFDKRQADLDAMYGRLSNLKTQ